MIRFVFVALLLAAPLAADPPARQPAPPAAKADRRCPVCRGLGYNEEADFQEPGRTVVVTCQDCDGTGRVKSTQVAARQQPTKEPARQPAPAPVPPAPAPDPEPAAAPRITGELNVAPYRMVRLEAVGVPAKAGLVWKVRPLDPGTKSEAVDWSTAKNIRKPEWVAPPGQYRVELSIGSVGSDGTMALDYTEVLVTIGAAPQPPPGPAPTPPGPTPPGPTPPTPAPIAGDGLRVLVVFESAKLTALPPGQLAALYSKSVRDYLRSKCAKGPDGTTPEFRFYDADVDLTAETPTWRDAMKRARTVLPWVVVSNPQKGGGYEGPLPATAEDFLALLKKWGD